MPKEEIKNVPLDSVELVAIKAALSAGEVVKSGFHTTFSTKRKSHIHDLVTPYDAKAEETISKIILENFSSHALLGEETGLKGEAKDNILWVVDPIDGTANFARKIPSFAISIAATYEGKTYVAACYDPIAEELYIAVKDKGATLNGEKIHISPIATLEESALSVNYAPGLEPLHEKALIRRSGSTVNDINYVAKGALEGYIERLLNPWDFAASMLILEEAGGTVTDLSGNEITIHPGEKQSILASNGHIHKELYKWTSKVVKSPKNY